MRKHVPAEINLNWRTGVLAVPFKDDGHDSGICSRDALYASGWNREEGRKKYLDVLKTRKSGRPDC